MNEPIGDVGALILAALVIRLYPRSIAQLAADLLRALT